MWLEVGYVLAAGLVVSQGAAVPLLPAWATSRYVPVEVSCPAEPLLRPAKGLCDAETAFLKAREPVANAALAAWLATIDPAFETSNLPGLAFLTSGGGARSFLSSSGVIQAMDDRETLQSPLAGLWQAMLYHAGNSGGSWLVSSLAANNWTTITNQTQSLWTQSLSSGLWDPHSPINHTAIPRVAGEIIAKHDAGFEINWSDVWGRLLSEQFIMAPEGGVATTFSSLAESPSFQAGAHPLPILAALTVNTANGNCMAGDTGHHFEFTPYEFGSWEDGIGAFTPTKYLGTPLISGNSIANSTTGSTCVNRFDNVGYIFGGASSMFNTACNASNLPAPDVPIVKEVAQYVESKVASLLTLFAEFPNPFHESPINNTLPYISQNTTLMVVDGGEEMENDPIWPFLSTDRPVDVLFINDNSADTTRNYPNGSELYTSSQKAQKLGITKMPEIPTPDYFVTNDNRPVFFGCKDPDQLTIIYLLNKQYSFASGYSTYKFQYQASETAGMIQNGNAIATLDGDKEWPLCVACAVMQKTNVTMPSGCTECLQKYCYN